jgi:hypothetical protein
MDFHIQKALTILIMYKKEKPLERKLGKKLLKKKIYSLL